MSDFKGLFEIRDGKESDRAFITATFLRGLYYGDSWFSLIPKDIYMKNYKFAINTILNNPRIVVKIACLPDDKDVIVGYSILSEDLMTIHWVHVKKIWRKNGIGRALLPAYPKYVSHLTSVGKMLMNKFDNCKFNPFSI